MISSISETIPDELLLKAKQDGFSDRQIGDCIGLTELDARKLRVQRNIKPQIKQIDTLAAEYPAITNYLYSTSMTWISMTTESWCWDVDLIILVNTFKMLWAESNEGLTDMGCGGMCGRIRQGVQQRYQTPNTAALPCCSAQNQEACQVKRLTFTQGSQHTKRLHDIVILIASYLTDNVPDTTITVPVYVLSHQMDRPSRGGGAVLGKKTVVVNHNPETVSTDFDECDRLYFEELSLERILDIYEQE
eukprot:g46105.t1